MEVLLGQLMMGGIRGGGRRPDSGMGHLDMFFGGKGAGMGGRMGGGMGGDMGGMGGHMGNRMGNRMDGGVGGRPFQTPPVGAVEVSGADAERALSQSGAYIMVMADWCDPCQAAKPYFMQHAQRNREPHYIIKDTNTALIRRLGITGFPTFLRSEGNGLRKIDYCPGR